MQSYAIRLLCLAGVLAAVAGGPVAAETPAAAVGRRSLSALDADILTGLNAVRAAHDLAPLTTSSRLTSAATSHTLEMVAGGYFGHRSSDGASFAGHIERYYPSAGYRHWSVGENLIWSAHAIGARGVVRAWMASAFHRANILDPGWRQIGIAAIHVPAAPGAYGGRTVTVITTDFGVRG